MVAINFASSTRLTPPTFMSAVAISRLTMPLRAQGTPLRAIAAAMRAWRASWGQPALPGDGALVLSGVYSEDRSPSSPGLASIKAGSPPPPIHPKLGPVEPFERNLARRLLDGCSGLRRSRPTTLCACRSTQSATRRRVYSRAHFPTPREVSLRPCRRKSPLPRPLPPSAQAYDICTL